MGHMLSDDEAASLEKRARRRPNTWVYPWRDWTNGKWWHLRPGVDFHCKPNSFPVMLYAHARYNDLVASVRTQPDGSVFVQFRKP